MLGYQSHLNGGRMLKYSEASEVPTKRRVLRLQGGAAKDVTAVAEPASPAVIDLRDQASSVTPEPTVESVNILPLQLRRAVGRTLMLLGHLFDFLALLIPLTLGYLLLNDQISMKVVVLFAAVGTALLWPTSRRGRHAVAPSEGLASVVGRLGLAPVVTLIIVSIVNIGRFGMPSESIDVFVIAEIVLATVPLVLLGRLLSFRLVASARSKGYDLEDALIIGVGPIGLDVAQALLDTPSFGLVPCGFVDRFQEELPLPILGRPENLPEILQQTGIRHVVLAFGSAGEEELVSIIRRCQDRMVQFYAVPRLFELGLSAGDVGYEVSGLPLVPVRRPGMSCNMWPAKRAFDLVAASFLFLLTLPLLVACALAVKLTSRGPVFFRQVRIGVGGRPFEILKFRSMKVNDESSTQWSVEEDDRVTAVGRFLRPSHLDELPQLLNVLRGEMSLVGPRPERPHFVEQFSSEIDSYQYRHRVPVGITGWAQVNGYWGDTSIETRVRLDNRYIENWSLWRDLVIGLRTIPTLLGKRR